MKNQRQPEFTELEKDLRELRPQAPGEALRERIRTGMENANVIPFPISPDPNPAGREAPVKRRFWPQAVGAAAALAVAGGLLVQGLFTDKTEPDQNPGAVVGVVPTNVSDVAHSSPDGDNAPTRHFSSGLDDIIQRQLYQPTGARTTVRQEHNEGLIFVDGKPMRRLRYDLTDQMEWMHPVSGRRVSVTRPRKQILLVPADPH